MLIVGVTALLIVMANAPDVTEVGDTHAALEVSVHTTDELADTDGITSVALLLPAGLLFTVQLYTGLAPPLVIVARIVSGLPAHTVLVPLSVMVGATGAEMVTTIVREVAVAGDTQVPDGVITQVILCVPAVSDEVANVAPVPILVAPSFHW